MRRFTTYMNVGVPSARNAMGDHRMDIKIEIEFHGVKRKTDMWINYMPHSEYTIDSRIVEFVNDAYKAGMKVYERQVQEYFEQEHAKEIEAKERAELKRLQEKYNT